MTGGDVHKMVITWWCRLLCKITWWWRLLWFYTVCML